jgi:streptogramin lyase
VLRLWLFGRVRFEAGDGSVVQIKRERPQRLIAWLALEASGQEARASRRRIAESLWGGTREPGNSLVHAVRELAQVLGDDFDRYVSETDDGLALTAGVWVDVDEFWRLASDDSSAALELSRQPFLDPVTRSAAPWHRARREEIEAERRRLRAADGPAEQAVARAARRASPAAGGRPSRLRLASIVAAVALATAAAIAAIGVLANSWSSSDARCGTGLTAPDPADERAGRARHAAGSPRTLTPVPVGERPVAVAVGREGVWVAERGGVVLIDPSSGRQAFPVIEVTNDPPSRANAPFSLALSRDRVWAARRDGVLVSIDRSTRRWTGKEMRYGRGPAAVALGNGAVWVNNYQDEHEGSITRIDACSGDLRRVQVGRGANTVVSAFGSLWVTDSVDRSVERVDPGSGRKIASIGGVDDPQDAIAADGLLWVTEYGQQSLRTIDPRSNHIVGSRIEVGPDPAGMAAGAGAVWVPLYGNGTLTRVDLRTHRAELGAARAGESPTDAAVGFGRVWAPNSDGDTVTPVRP